jgi:hypothetical protein
MAGDRPKMISSEGKLLALGADLALATADTAILTLLSPALGFLRPMQCTRRTKARPAGNRTAGTAAQLTKPYNYLTANDLVEATAAPALTGRFRERPLGDGVTCEKGFRKGQTIAGFQVRSGNSSGRGDEAR